MPTPNIVPINTYAAVTGVVNTTAAAEIAALIVLLLTLIPDTDHADAQTTPPEGVAPEYDKWHPAVASNMRQEIAALATAIAAAPTA